MTVADIQIEVRSPFQKMILDTLWQFDTMEQCLAFRDSLPNTAQQQICTAMIMMLAYEYIDQQTLTEADCETARDILSSY
jgi:hypothetical protein